MLHGTEEEEKGKMRRQRHSQWEDHSQPQTLHIAINSVIWVGTRLRKDHIALSVMGQMMMMMKMKRDKFK